jgi:hypothetical protein
MNLPAIALEIHGVWADADIRKETDSIYTDVGELKRTPIWSLTATSLLG